LARTIARIILWLYVINLGIAVGAGWYESRIVIPQWLIESPDAGTRWNAEAARQDNTGVRFWVYVNTVPGTLLTLASLVVAWRTPPPVRNWWLAAVAAGLVDRVMTLSYFIPTMVTLMSGTLPESEAVARATQWVNLNYVRHTATIVAWLAALKAFSSIGAIPRK
jgi:hypothetical protein